MGTRERREREKQELRGRILAAARSIAAHEGWQAVSIRRIADAIEYSPPIIYEFFASKEALLLELIREAEQLLLDSLRAARATSDDPEAALLAMARAYWDFAWSYPELYQVMHGMDGVPFCDSLEDDTIGQEIFEEVYAALSLVLPATPAQQLAMDDLVQILWATLHGIVSLTMVSNLEGGREANFRLVDLATQALIVGWRGIDKMTR
ncbi:MAG: TetR/AcrR family transcriptional regulator [Chloroflexaceae bacterium]|jgi:AcrR family transcriptional regulator|nr:TetR/AcrR family transcriptional regulator [Chloroflexaceae bacterium]